MENKQPILQPHAADCTDAAYKLQEAGITQCDRRPARVPSDNSKKLKILVLCNYDLNNASTACDHINSFSKYSDHTIFLHSNLGNLQNDFDLTPFDVVVIHYSLTLAIEAYIGPRLARDLRRFNGLKVLFIQDDYRFVNRTIEAINYCKISLVFTALPEAKIGQIYPPLQLPGTKFVSVLTGYAPSWLSVYPTIPFKSRTIDVGYRGRSYPAWLGLPGLERIEIGARFLADAKNYKLKCNIRWEEKDRLYGLDWVEFIRSCRSVLATESNAGIIDYDGDISTKINIFSALLDRDKLPANSSNPVPGMRSHYNEMRERYFAEQDEAIDISVVSPRVFEAAALRTVLIMYEGRYSGIFKANRHFIPLKKDHSNMKSVVDTLKDDEACAEIAANAFSEIIQNPVYSYRSFISTFDSLISQAFGKEPRPESSDISRADFDKKYPFFILENPYGIISSNSTTNKSINSRLRKNVHYLSRKIRLILNTARLGL